MGSTFNPQILVDKLTKLNVSQTSIETLSHWCIFHMYKAKQVVETWDRQFHCAPREQRLAFLYLANDILQNSRRKGSDFVGEFWKVLPDALRDVIQNGDEAGRASAMRLIHIWEERKVFGSRGQILKEEFLGRKIESTNRNGKDSGLKLRHNAGSALDNVVTGYQIVYGGPMDDEAVLSKCLNIMDFFDKVEKEISDDNNSEKFRDSAFADELRQQSAMLRNCIDQLTTVESSRARLVSNLREALEEQEFKLDQVRNQLQSARSRSELANKLCHQFLNGNGNGNGNNRPLSVDPSLKDAQSHNTPAEREQSAPVMYTRQVPSFPNRSAVEEDTRKSAAAEVAAKLSASTSSAQMLSYVLSSLASEGVISHKAEDSPPEKRSKTESSSPYIPSLPPNNPPQPPLPRLDPSVPPPPTSPPPMPPLPPMPSYPMLQPPSFTPLSGPSNGLPYYGMTQQLQQQPLPPPPPSAPSYTPISGGLPPFTGQPPPAGPYPGFPGSDGNNLYSQPPPAPMAPISRQ